MMKKMLFLMLFLMFLGAVNVSSQVRIGGNDAPHEAAVLDLNATDADTPTQKGGLALPRVSLATTTANLNEKAPIAGMLVYNTNSDITGTGNAGTGIYYWDGNNWVNVASAAGNKLPAGSNNTVLMKRGDTLSWVAFGGWGSETTTATAASSTVSSLTMRKFTTAKAFTLGPWQAVYFGASGVSQNSVCATQSDMIITHPATNSNNIIVRNPTGSTLTVKAGTVLTCLN